MSRPTIDQFGSGDDGKVPVYDAATNSLKPGGGGGLSNEAVQDLVGAMVTGNTETGITVTYQDSDGTLDFAVSGASPPGHVILVTGLVEDDDTFAAANTAIIQAALDEAANYGVVHGPLSPYLAGDNTGGVRVVLPSGVYYISRSVGIGDDSACIWIGDHTTLSGQGMGTRLVIKSGVITLGNPCCGIKCSNTTNWCGLENMAYDGGWNVGDAVTDTSYTSHGFDFQRIFTSDFYDGGFHASNCMFFGCQGTGMYGHQGTNTMRAWDIYSYHNAGNGFDLQTDQALWGCKAGNNKGGSGFFIQNGSNVLLSGCKAFGNGVDYAINYSESIQLDNCESEDFSGSAAIRLQAVRGCRINAVVYRCQSDDAASTALYYADDAQSAVDPYDGTRSYSNVIDLTVMMIPPSGVQVYPQYHLVTRHVGGGTQIRINGQPDTWQTARHLSLGGSIDGQISFNSSAQQAVHTIPYAASITPDADLGEIVFVGALTGNLTVNAPARNHRGQRLTFCFVQDATGTRTVTLNAAFKPTSTFTAATGNGARSSISFLCDGTDWLETSRSTPPTTALVEIGVAVSDEATEITTGAAKVAMRMPYAMTLTAVRSSLSVDSSSGLVTVDINEGGSTILSTKLSIDATEKTSTTAATAAVISDTVLTDDAEITFDVDAAGTGAKGLKVWLIGTRT